MCKVAAILALLIFLFYRLFKCIYERDTRIVLYVNVTSITADWLSHPAVETPGLLFTSDLLLLEFQVTWHTSASR